MENWRLHNPVKYIKNRVSETCDGCIWEEVCANTLPCYDYSPIDEDSELDEYIEARRYEFGKDWDEYMREWN